MFNIGQPEKNFDTLTPSRVAEVMRTFKFEARVLIKRFIKPNSMSLQQRGGKNIYKKTMNEPPLFRGKIFC